ncbi:phytoene/squalene synthase family protein [Azohydromonas caseinilytica]|uniref:Phytoene/squalene synthase family protein n=1 Tax=Azohydromonas caseinilytica TaxID=2728836 RepID=A0A848FBF9_9BURK|nr:phytoene/squalene synthase family protein [Azohydromonas caseinilytica]NML16854.1 phytoene/squalene synthase family protein [Azohydromonas caseinilytica]
MSALRNEALSSLRALRLRRALSGATADADAARHGRQAIQAGSSSFAAAAKLFDPATRRSTVMLYAWCRHCDDVIDGQQLGHGQREGDRSHSLQRLAELEELTHRACAGRSCGQVAFDGLAEVVRRHGIPPMLPLEHLRGFRMDVQGEHYETLSDTLLYCYRVAGVVGLMMARVMGTRDAATLDRACDLGLAFQLTNIARDIVEDAAIGRIYVPLQWLHTAGIPPEEVGEPRHRAALAGVAARVVAAADPYYASALLGLGALPVRSAWSVATARGVYREIGRKVRQRGAQAWDARARTSGAEKAWFVARGMAVALAARALPARPRAEGLWQRPWRA